MFGARSPLSLFHEGGYFFNRVPMDATLKVKKGYSGMPKILAIDDIRENLDFLSSLLTRLIPNCAILTEVSGRSGIEKAFSELPDTILLDVKMPEMDGYEVCDTLKKNDLTRHIPIIMLTGAKMGLAEKIKGLDAGADAFMTKPIEGAELVAQINVMLRIRHAEALLRKEKDLLEGIVQKRSRALMTMSECNKALVRAADEHEFINEICRIIVEQGGYRLAWVGFGLNDEAKSIQPAAQFGYEEGYLDTLHISWADTERGRGPIGTAIRTGKPCVIQQIVTNIRYAPWRNEALKRGYAAVISLPLTIDQEVIGALTIYAEEPNAFDSNEIILLTELSRDLSYGIKSIRTQEEKNRAQAHIHLLTQDLIKAQEIERQRIARDLHDHVAQDLASLKISCETFFGSEKEITNGLRQKIGTFTSVLQSSIEAVRNLAYDLQPPRLDQIGLVQTIYNYCQDFSFNHGVKVELFSAGVEDLTLDFDTEINIYRLIQEALNNIKKHSGATRAVIRFVAAYPDLILRIEDNGKGFDVRKTIQETLTRKRMGLRNMEERAHILKGSFSIQSKRREGTRILIKIPINQRDPADDVKGKEKEGQLMDHHA